MTGTGGIAAQGRQWRQEATVELESWLTHPEDASGMSEFLGLRHKMARHGSFPQGTFSGRDDGVKWEWGSSHHLLAGWQLGVHLHGTNSQRHWPLFRGPRSCKQVHRDGYKWWALIDGHTQMDTDRSPRLFSSMKPERMSEALSHLWLQTGNCVPRVRSL